MTWYSRSPCARLELTGGGSRRAALLAERIRSSTGYQVTLFDMTREHDVPAVWAMATHPQDHPDEVKAVSADGAHLDPAQMRRMTVRYRISATM